VHLGDSEHTFACYHLWAAALWHCWGVIDPACADSAFV
jgi:hypothetical protein